MKLFRQPLTLLAVVCCLGFAVACGEDGDADVEVDATSTEVAPVDTVMVTPPLTDSIIDSTREVKNPPPPKAPTEN